MYFPINTYWHILRTINTKLKEIDVKVIVLFVKRWGIYLLVNCYKPAWLFFRFLLRARASDIKEEVRLWIFCSVMNGSTSIFKAVVPEALLPRPLANWEPACARQIKTFRDFSFLICFHLCCDKLSSVLVQSTLYCLSFHKPWHTRWFPNIDVGTVNGTFTIEPFPIWRER